MAQTQLTLIQIDNYGPWTVTPTPRREVDLQTMQSRLYADLSQLFGVHDGYVFFTRFDNMIAVTNGIDRQTHARIQESIANRYPVTISCSVANGPTPVVALSKATERLQAAGSAQDGERRQILDQREAVTDASVHIAHFDVNDATGTLTDELNAFDTFIHIEAGYATLMKHMREEYDALSFFVGGDNVIAVCPPLTEAEYHSAIESVNEQVEVSLKVGAGSGKTAHVAGMKAKHALEQCRHRDIPVVLETASTPSAPTEN